MNWKTTCALLVCAGLLFGFIYFYEQRHKSTANPAAPPALVPVKATEVSAIQIRRTNQFLLRVERTNGLWNLTAPLAYSAQPHTIEAFLRSLSSLRSQTLISLEELAQAKRSVAAYGLDVPVATVTLQQGAQRLEILFGSKTAVGDQIYVQVNNAPGVHVVGADILDQIPRVANDWRDPTLITFAGLNFDRIEVRSAARSFAIQADPTNKIYLLTKPILARAHTAKVLHLIQNIRAARISQYVSDHPRDDFDTFGLQPPETELVFGLGTNDAAVFQFGKSPTNDAAQVFFRRAGRPHVMLVPKSVVDALQIPAAELRDRRLVSVAPEAVDTVEVANAGGETFSVRRQFNGAWVVLDAHGTLADSDIMRDCLIRLGKLEGTVEKDVVTDFATYGLEPFARRYSLKSTITNLSGQVTNRLLAQLDLGMKRGDAVFARGAEDKSVYTVPVSEVAAVPYASWQLRDRRVWSFSTNQVTRVSVRHNGYTRQLVRNAAGAWTLAPGSEGVIVSEAVDEALHQLSELRATVWVARGDEQKAEFGFTGEGYKITLELKNGDKPQNLAVEFGGKAPSLYPYALAAIDGQNWIFEFPLAVYLGLIRDLSNPPPRSSQAAVDQ